MHRTDLLAAAIVRPAPGETVIGKDRPNAFLGTGLEGALRDAGVDLVTICGAMSQMCVDVTARAAADLGLAVVVAHDACCAASVRFGGVTVPAAQVHAEIMAPLAASCAVLTSTDGLVAARAAA